MQNGFSVFWWISVFEIPVVGFLFYMIRNNRIELEKKIFYFENVFENRNSLLLKEVASFKIYSAREYVSFSHLKDVEKRLVSHLLRIENKLEENLFK